MGLTFNLGRVSPSVFTDSSLNVGIGAAPSGSYKLEVTGTAKVSSTLLVSGAATFSGFVGINGSPATAFPLEAYINSATAYSSTSRGNVMRVYNSNTGANIFAGIELGGAGTANDGLAGLNAVVTGSGSAALTFYTRDGGTFAEKVRISSAGNVGIGTSTFNYAGAGTGYLAINGSSSNFLEFQYGTTGTSGWITGNSSTLNMFTSGPKDLLFGTAGGEKMRITSGGQIQQTTAIADWSHTITNSSSTSPNGLYIVYSNANKNNSSNQFIYCVDNFSSSLRFAVYSNGNVVNQNNSYGSTSDIKLKENITDATPKLQDLLKVKVKNYNFIGDDKKQIGVVAQELEEIFPSMIEESNDIIKDENGENIETGEKTKSVKYSVFVPMLIKAMQEQQAQIQNLQEQINILAK